ncbi:MAG TPA: hypothetical protein VEQ63_02085 [Bryobacteraceae bacterium]|nr:hypothetical protein [Bryobacteraceae bacterium]
MNSKFWNACRVLAVCVAVGVSAPSWSRAAEGEEYKSEVAAFTGVQRLPGLTKPMIGGSIGTAVGTNSMLFFEPSYVALGSGVKLVNLLGGLNIGFTTQNPKLVPYLSLVGGLGRFSGGGESEHDPVYGAGFGVRYFVGSNWGIKPEFRWQRYQAEDGGNTYVFKAGVFYRFGSR